MWCPHFNLGVKRCAHAISKCTSEKSDTSVEMSIWNQICDLSVLSMIKNKATHFFVHKIIFWWSLMYVLLEMLLMHSFILTSFYRIEWGEKWIIEHDWVVTKAICGFFVDNIRLHQIHICIWNPDIKSHHSYFVGNESLFLPIQLKYTHLYSS